MGLYVIKKQTPTTIKILKTLIFIFLSGMVVGGYYIYKKHNENIQRNIETNPLSNLTYEVERIQELYGKENIQELQLSKKTITFKIDENQNLEPLISRYQDMINVVFNKNGFNIVKIDKANIIDKTTLKK